MSLLRIVVRLYAAALVGSFTAAWVLHGQRWTAAGAIGALFVWAVLAVDQLERELKQHKKGDHHGP